MRTSSWLSNAILAMGITLVLIGTEGAFNRVEASCSDDCNGTPSCLTDTPPACAVGLCDIDFICRWADCICEKSPLYNKCQCSVAP